MSSLQHILIRRSLLRTRTIPRSITQGSRPLSNSTPQLATYRRFGVPEPSPGGSSPFGSAGGGGSSNHNRWGRNRKGWTWSLDMREWSTRQRVGAGVVGIGGTYYVSHLEQVPETGRWRFMNTTPKFETMMAREVKQQLQAEYGSKVLPANHPITKHVANVVERILQSNGLGSLSSTTTTASAPSSWSDADPWNMSSSSSSSSNGNDGAFAPGTAAGSENREWNLLVVNDPRTVNAMASFGNIVVFTGILSVARDPDGLAAVLAHEIGHVTARHNSEKVSQAQVGLVISSLLIAVLGLDFGLSGLLQQYLVELPGDRRVELEADAIGLRLMSRACYRPEAAPEMFERLGKVSERAINVDFLYTHPTSETRIKALEALMPAARNIQASSECEATQSAFTSFRNTIKQPILGW